MIAKTVPFSKPEVPAASSVTVEICGRMFPVGVGRVTKKQSEQYNTTQVARELGEDQCRVLHALTDYGAGWN